MVNITGKQAVIGCAVSCLALVLVAALVIAGFAFWVTRPGELIEPERLFGADTTGYVAWMLRLEDPGTEAFVASLADTLVSVQREQNAALPEPLGTIVTALNARTANDVRKIFPVAVVWTSSPAVTEEDDLQLLSFSLASGGNRLVFVDWMLGMMLSQRSDGAVRTHAGERIYNLTGDRGEALTFFIRGNDLFFASDVATAERAIDRLSGAPAEPRPPGDLDRLYSLTSEGATLRGAVSNARGEIRRLWREFDEGASEEPAWDELSGIAIAGGLTAEGAFEGTLELVGRDAGWAAERSTPHVEAIRTWLERTPFAFESSSQVVGEHVRITVRATELFRKLERLGEKHAEKP